MMEVKIDACHEADEVVVSFWLPNGHCFAATTLDEGRVPSFKRRVTLAEKIRDALRNTAP